MGTNVHNTLKSKILPSKARLKIFEFKEDKHTFYVNNHSLNIFRVRTKFPVFSLSGKSKNQIPCFPCSVDTLNKENCSPF